MSTIDPLLSLIQKLAPTATGTVAPTLKVGAVVDALVLALLADGTTRLATPQGQLTGRSEAPLMPGSLVRLEVTAPGQLRLVETLATGGGQAPPAGPGTHSAPAMVGGTAAADTGQRISPPSHAPLPQATATAQAAVLETATRAAAGQQRSLAPLLADLAALAARPGDVLPVPVRAAAAAVLALPLDTEGLGVETLRTAFARSGLFREAQLAVPAPAAGAAPPAADLKSALLALRDALQNWRAGMPATLEGKPAVIATASTASGASVPSAVATAAATASELPPNPRTTGEPLARAIAQSLLKVAADPRPLVALGPQRMLLNALVREARMQPSSAPVAAPEPAAAAGPAEAVKPPPYRHGPLSPQPTAESTLAPDAAPEEIATRLLGATEGALARHTLTQIASLPDPGAEVARGERAQAWTFELPMRTPDGIAVVPFEIARDGRHEASDADGEGPQAPSWQARFSTELTALGPVHAQVALNGDRVSVTLWAERDATAASLAGGMPILEAALREAALDPGALRILPGAPRAQPAPPGKFLDQAT